MRRVLLVDATESYLLSIEGRLRSYKEVAGVRRTNDQGGLALLVDVPDGEALASLVENRINLLTGVQGCRALTDHDPTLAAQFS